ncbi:spore germination protein [Paenibacillus sp. R14(2021)]|uniref:spore germination protein n=1 Tax=Paenibacillus sp. R14(2021) TaxID=2859228 RepID=UPI001C6151ED|nr:spore germination protein [Paenibacillus sp. R14(2021)]
MQQILPGKQMADEVTKRLGHSTDLTCQKLQLAEGLDGFIIFLGTLVADSQIEEWIVGPLIRARDLGHAASSSPAENMVDHIFSVRRQTLNNVDECIAAVLEGQCLLIPEDGKSVVSYDVSKIQYRSVTEPITESVIRGPREGFIEDVDCNVSLIRKRLKSEQLVFEKIIVGSVTKTKLFLSYMHDTAPAAVVDEFRQRLLSIQTDSILESAYIEEWIQNKGLSPFPQLISTERPDVVTAKLIEGQVAVMTDGTPFVLVGPITFFQLFVSPEDYYQRADIAILLRWLRMFAFLLAVFVPPLFIAVVSYHQEMLPTTLLINLAAQREAVPFPAFIEALIMMITFELLREAGLRMPRIAGQTISIVGALVLGQAAVEAGLVSAAMVIVVSLTAISNFISPSYSFGISQRILQFIFMALAGVMGLFGIMCGGFFLLIHLSSLRSFGVNYMTPVAPLILSDWKDTLVRVPRKYMAHLSEKKPFQTNKSER